MRHAHRLINDPTYDRTVIDADPEWELAFILSEIINDEAPLGWSRYIGTAKCLLAAYDMRRKSDESSSHDQNA